MLWKSVSGGFFKCDQLARQNQGHDVRSSQFVRRDLKSVCAKGREGYNNEKFFNIDGVNTFADLNQNLALKNSDEEKSVSVRSANWGFYENHLVSLWRHPKFWWIMKLSVGHCWTVNSRYTVLYFAVVFYRHGQLPSSFSHWISSNLIQRMKVLTGCFVHVAPHFLIPSLLVVQFDCLFITECYSFCIIHLLPHAHV